QAQIGHDQHPQPGSRSCSSSNLLLRRRLTGKGRTPPSSRFSERIVRRSSGDGSRGERRRARCRRGAGRGEEGGGVGGRGRRRQEGRPGRGVPAHGRRARRHLPRALIGRSVDGRQSAARRIHVRVASSLCRSLARKRKGILLLLYLCS
uniref:Uncharacterized protein n=1 Tax=Triticum urartu TaxID=4572 RepID=A0A8R7PQF1_TRIUA